MSVKKLMEVIHEQGLVVCKYITFWRVVSPRLVRCHLGASDKIVELNQGVCKGKEIAYFVKIYPGEASPSWTMTMVG